MDGTDRMDGTDITGGTDGTDWTDGTDMNDMDKNSDIITCTTHSSKKLLGVWTLYGAIPTFRNVLSLPNFGGAIPLARGVQLYKGVTAN